MTNPTPHGQVPEALIDLIDAYAETRHRCGGVYNAKTEAARKAVIKALSGVQALSAAPATPPAEQQATTTEAALGGVYAELPDPGHRGPNGTGSYFDSFTRDQMRDFADRTHALRLQAAPKAAPAQQEWRLVLPGGKYTDKWESARIGDYNRGWNDYRKTAIAALNSVVWPARTSGSWVGASTWLRNNYQDYPNIASLCDAMLEAAPQQEAQEPVATLHCNDVGYVWARATEVGKLMRFEQPLNLYTAPQPPTEPATQQPEGDVVAYLDVGAGGYLDLGSELSEDALQQLPKGRHALVIAGTYGIDGYVAAPQPSPTAQSADSVQEDAARLDFLIEQRAYVVSDPDACPGYWLHFVHKETGKCWVQDDEHPTPRAAIDAARKQGGAT